MRAAALALVCACSLGGQRPQYDYYVLSAGERVPAAPPRPSHATVGLSHVSMPDYLDREPIVTRSEDGRVVYSKRDRWAEPLDAAFERVLEQDLAAALAPSGITVPPRTASPTYDVQVDVIRFERRSGEHVELWARWTVRSESKLIHTDESRLKVRTAGQGSAPAAAALSRAIAQLADEIAGQVEHATVAHGH